MATRVISSHIGQYTYFTSNPRWKDLPKTKHEIVWQPKFGPGGGALQDRLPDGEIEPAALIAALERPTGDGDEAYGCHVAEFAGSRESDRTILAGCLDHLTRPNARSEYWLLSDSEETARGHYDAFSQEDAALRFQCLDPASEPSMEEGLLRPGSVEVAFLHGSDDLPGPDGWQFLQRLSVPGGLALIRHEDGGGDEGGDGDGDENSGGIELGEGWTVVRAGRCTTLLQAPHFDVGETADGPLPEPRWMLGAPSSWASERTARLDAPEAVGSIPHEAVVRGQFDSLEVWSQAAEVRAIDFFCGVEPHDPTGEMATAHFVRFVQALVSARLANANHVCRISVVTCRAAFEVEHPRRSALWGAVRSMAMEVGDEAKLDFRLVDLGDADDLETLGWLARRDLREREIAVRENRLWAPRVSSIRKRYAHVAAGDDAKYRLTLDNPGQIAGLQMKTYELPSVGPNDVKIEIEAAALNFRDVMVTLGLLPALAYERSALGRKVGMEGSGTVRQVVSKVRHCAVGDRVAFIAGVAPAPLGGAAPNRLARAGDSRVSAGQKQTRRRRAKRPGDGRGIEIAGIRGPKALRYVPRTGIYGQELD